MFRINSWHYFLLMLLCIGLIATAIYMEHNLGLEPCPLCAITRLVVICAGGVALLGWIIRFAGFRRFLGFILTIISIIGIVTSARHVWLQHLPKDEIPDCGPGLDYIVDAFPFSEALSMIFSGSGECAEVQWVFLSFSIPEWTLMIFVLIFVFAFMSTFRSMHKTKNRHTLSF